MSQVTSVRAVPVSPETLPETQPELPLKVERKPDPQRRPWLYNGTNKIDTMSNRQLLGALKRARRDVGLPRERGEKYAGGKAALTDVAMATALEAILDAFMHGRSPYPR